jgi:transcriptional regulator with XRE-family HTH domain
VTADISAHAARPDDTDTLSSLLQRVFAEHPELTQKEVADRAGISKGTLNTWVLGTRGGAGRLNSEALRALANALPREYTVAQVFAAAGRRAPGPLNVERRDKLVGAFSELTERQQRAVIELIESMKRPE